MQQTIDIPQILQAINFFIEKILLVVEDSKENLQKEWQYIQSYIKKENPDLETLMLHIKNINLNKYQPKVNEKFQHQINPLRLEDLCEMKKSIDKDTMINIHVENNVQTKNNFDKEISNQDNNRQNESQIAFYQDNIKTQIQNLQMDVAKLQQYKQKSYLSHVIVNDNEEINQENFCSTLETFRGNQNQKESFCEEEQIFDDYKKQIRTLHTAKSVERKMNLQESSYNFVTKPRETTKENNFEFRQNPIVNSEVKDKRFEFLKNQQTLPDIFDDSLKFSNQQLQENLSQLPDNKINSQESLDSQKEKKENSIYSKQNHRELKSFDNFNKLFNEFTEVRDISLQRGVGDYENRTQKQNTFKILEQSKNIHFKSNNYQNKLDVNSTDNQNLPTIDKTLVQNGGSDNNSRLTHYPQIDNVKSRLDKILEKLKNHDKNNELRENQSNKQNINLLLNNNNLNGKGEQLQFISKYNSKSEKEKKFEKKTKLLSAINENICQFNRNSDFLNNLPKVTELEYDINLNEIENKKEEGDNDNKKNQSIIIFDNIPLNVNPRFVIHVKQPDINQLIYVSQMNQINNLTNFSSARQWSQSPDHLSSIQIKSNNVTPQGENQNQNCFRSIHNTDLNTAKQFTGVNQYYVPNNIANGLIGNIRTNFHDTNLSRQSKN